jgi:hypothetical protein
VTAVRAKQRRRWQGAPYPPAPERHIRRTIRPAGVEALVAAMDASSDEARRRGLTDDILQAEREAYTAERRGPRAAA